VYGGLLIFSCDGSDAALVVALDKQTGKVKWQTNRRSPADQAYTTPLVIGVADRDQLVSVGAYRATAYDPLNGKEIWRVSYADGFSNVPRPVFAHGLVYIATGFQQPSLLAVRPDGTGDITKTHTAWKLSRGAPLTPSPPALMRALAPRFGSSGWVARIQRHPFLPAGAYTFRLSRAWPRSLPRAENFAGWPPTASMAGCWRRWPSRAARCS